MIRKPKPLTEKQALVIKLREQDHVPNWKIAEMLGVCAQRTSGLYYKACAKRKRLQLQSKGLL